MTSPTVEEVEYLRRLEARRARAAEREAELRRERDDQIRSLVGQGMTHAQIYRALEGVISRARIGQIALEGNHDNDR